MIWSFIYELFLNIANLPCDVLPMKVPGFPVYNGDSVSQTKVINVLRCTSIIGRE